MQIQANVNIHNRFDMEVVDARTGKVRQTATAYNIVLDNMWTTLCNGQAFFTHVSFGEGTGELSAARTSLFNQIASLSATVVETVKALPESYVKKSVTLPMGTYTGKTISEVGVYGSRLNTHALLEDSEGQPISITVGEFDIVTIYATVYSTFAIENPDDMTLISMPDNNSLVNYLTGGSAPSGSFSVGQGDGDGAITTTGCSTPTLGSTSSVSWTADVPNKKRVSSSARLATTSGNGHIMEVAFSNLFRARLPITGMFEGQSYAGVPVGTGDGVAKKFLLPSRNVKQESVVIKADGVAVPVEDYSLSLLPALNHNLSLQGSGSSNGYQATPDGKTLWDSTTSTAYVLDFMGGTLVPRKPLTPAGSSSAVNPAVLSGNGKVCACGDSFDAPRIRVFDWAGGEWVARDMALLQDVIQSNYGSTVLSNDGKVFGFSRPCRICDWSNGQWSVRPTIVAGNALYMQLSYDGNTVVIVTDTSPYIQVHDWVDGAWVDRGAPQGGFLRPSGTGVYYGNSLFQLLSSKTTLEIHSTSAPYIAVYDWVDGAWVDRGAPVSGFRAPTWVRFNASGTVLAALYSTAPYIEVYDWVGGAWVARSAPDGGFPSASAIGLNGDGTRLAANTTASPYVAVFEWAGGQWSQWAFSATNASSDTSHGNRAFIGDGYAMVANNWTQPYTSIYDIAARTTEVTFEDAPANGVAITADYTVKGLHKTDQYVVDLACAIQFGEPAV